MKTAIRVMTAACLLAASTTFAAAQSPEAKSGDAKKGRDLFVKVGCFGCHGFAGQGGVAGPKIAPDPMPAEAMIAFLRNAAGASRMPPYDARGLPDGDVIHIRAFLATIPKTGDWKKEPLLQP